MKRQKLTLIRAERMALAIRDRIALVFTGV